MVHEVAGSVELCGGPAAFARKVTENRQEASDNSPAILTSALLIPKPFDAMRYAALSLFLCLAGPAPATQRPNIIFVLADDLGYGDIGCYGCPDARTPHIDGLASDGARFTQFYANGPECTPSRTALMTGRYQQRVLGMECALGTGNVGRYDEAVEMAKDGELGLSPADAVLPRALKSGGYRCAIFGKWHLGYEMKFNPLEHGWDTFFGVLGGNCDYFTHRELSPLPVLFQGRTPVERDGYLTHLITGAALGFLEGQVAGAPFFLYLPYTTPHFPFQGPGDAGKELEESNFAKGPRSDYVSMLEDLDAQVGKLIEAVAAQGLSENTIVIVASDHGAMRPGRNLPLNGYKGGLFEGGIRAPLIVRWPGRLSPGTVVDRPFMMFDVTHSLLRVAGAPPEVLRGLDGIDLLQEVEAGRAEATARRQLFWRSRRGDKMWRAVRDGAWKYIWKTEGGKIDEWLFDLGSDPFESKNQLQSKAPLGVALREKLAAWERGVDVGR
jgi:N-acetylgalactosamine-6-sulfatase